MSQEGLDGARVKALRELKGIWSQQALADRVGVPQPHICDLERGKVRNIEVFLKVADELDCTTDFLFRRGPFADAENPEAFRAAASQMSFAVFASAIDVSLVQRERCQRVLAHPAAPVTANGWKSLAEMVELAVGPTPPTVRQLRA
jgi:transcriptional regulator with XRE-family HTH domain